MRINAAPQRSRSLTAIALAMLLALAATGRALELHAQQPVNLNFVNARLSDVIRSLATTLGVNVLLTNVPDKRITFQTTVPVRPEELGGILESILEANNLFLVQQGPVAQVFPADSLPPTGLVRSGIALGTPPPLGLVTVLVPLQWIRADEATAALEPVASARARIQPVARSNALLITDFGSNVARYLELLRPLDERPLGEEGLRTYVVPLKYANSEDLAASLGQLYGISVGGTRSTSLYDLSLSRNLDVFRERAAEMFRQRRDLTTPGVVPTSPGDSANQGALIGRTTVVPDAPTNSLLIRTAPPNFPLLRETIEALDTRPAQVLLEVTVAEINLGRSFEFGIDWGVFGDTASLTRGFPLPFDSMGIVRGDQITGVVSVGLNGTNVRAVLRALATKFNVRVLSTPEILAVNNREARIVVGSRVPFISNARLGDVSIDRSVQYEDVGTTLTIIPTINQDDYVSVQILQEVNNLTNQIVLSALNAPVISTREASTRAIIRDGQTVVIGGLIGDTKDYTDGGIPFLKDIPLLGALFKRKTEIVSRNELAIFVTPYIIRSDEDADAIRARIRERMNRMIPGTIPDTTLIRRR
jgi:general secretion pathway protein D